MTHQIKDLADYKKTYEHSIKNPEAFWESEAESFTWMKKWDKVLEWNFDEPKIEWFKGAKLNITVNCLDRHIKDRGDQTALLWEANDPSEPSKHISYSELLGKVCQCANALKELGIGKGDRVVFYMPMVPELAIGVLACARIGAIHSVVFAGFSAQALADRVDDAQAKMIICSDYNNRGAKHIAVKDVVDEAMDKSCNSVEHVLVQKNGNNEVNWSDDTDVWWHEIVDKQSKECEPEEMDAEDMLFILYTSGSTGKPKGVVHTCGGYMVYTCSSFRNVFQYKDGDVYWCTADIGWITGHSYIVYGPLLAGATSLMFEGVPTYPDAGRFWHICEKHKVNQFYTAPTAIRALMACGNNWPDNYDLSSLKLLGSVGEPINEEAWHWYDEHIGKKNSPIIDTWWQTETGGIMITPLPGITDAKPTFASYPLPGIQPILLDSDGNILEGNNVEGLLCVNFPWPSILRTTYGDHARCKLTYFSAFPGYYFTGDGARRDEDGRIRVIGRVDDVLNVSGHRMGTAEVENAINEHENVIESAVVGYPHDIKGQGIYAYVIINGVPSDDIINEIRAVVTREIGPIAKPDKIQVVPGLPKTRSGKIMRRILRKIASNELSNMGDVSTLLNPEVVDEVIAGRL
ncbi:acetate--CoA ligase [Portibacter lacus]|uniref:Acetate--CoA ligase n=1 Tax=Portibacter lacus TaxID=1099794 RepID=A0AA37SMT2_9BACT|nr:acetate--CoA ligase [Portibacter lacus]GLR15741.1 acetyl-coenzyme A synthetase [Portibacter lacus]